jgi:hypothetical protein
MKRMGWWALVGAMMLGTMIAAAAEPAGDGPVQRYIPLRGRCSCDVADLLTRPLTGPGPDGQRLSRLIDVPDGVESIIYFDQKPGILATGRPDALDKLAKLLAQLDTEPREPLLRVWVRPRVLPKADLDKLGISWPVMPAGCSDAAVVGAPAAPENLGRSFGDSGLLLTDGKPYQGGGLQAVTAGGAGGARWHKDECLDLAARRLPSTGKPRFALKVGASYSVFAEGIPGTKAGAEGRMMATPDTTYRASTGGLVVLEAGQTVAWRGAWQRDPTTPAPVAGEPLLGRQLLGDSNGWPGGQRPEDALGPQDLVLVVFVTLDFYRAGDDR